MEKASQLESAGDPQAARHMYKMVESESCFYFDAVRVAGEHAVRLQREIDKASADAEAALQRYFEMHGRYPAALAEIESDIPADSLPAFRHFHYFPDEDGQHMSFSSGLIGTMHFDLSGR